MLSTLSILNRHIFDLAQHGASSADFDSHGLFGKSANGKRMRRRLEFAMRSVDFNHGRLLI